MEQHRNRPPWRVQPHLLLCFLVVLSTLVVFTTSDPVPVTDYPFIIEAPRMTLVFEEAVPAFTLYPKNSKGETSFQDYMRISSVSHRERAGNDTNKDPVLWEDFFPNVSANAWDVTSVSNDDLDSISFVTDRAFTHVAGMEFNITIYKEDQTFPIYNIPGQFFNVSAGSAKLFYTISNVTFNSYVFGEAQTEYILSIILSGGITSFHENQQNYTNDITFTTARTEIDLHLLRDVLYLETGTIGRIKNPLKPVTSDGVWIGGDTTFAIPPFHGTAFYDPDFTILLLVDDEGDATLEDGSDEARESNSWWDDNEAVGYVLICIGVVILFVVPVVVIVTISVFIMIRRKKTAQSMKVALGQTQSFASEVEPDELQEM